MNNLDYTVHFDEIPTEEDRIKIHAELGVETVDDLLKKFEFGEYEIESAQYSDTEEGKICLVIYYAIENNSDISIDLITSLKRFPFLCFAMADMANLFDLKLLKIFIEEWNYDINMFSKFTIAESEVIQMDFLQYACFKCNDKMIEYLFEKGYTRDRIENSDDYFGDGPYQAIAMGTRVYEFEAEEFVPCFDLLLKHIGKETLPRWWLNEIFDEDLENPIAKECFEKFEFED